MTSIEFFALSRIVILDMLLTFFFSFALCAFFLLDSAKSRPGKSRLYFLLMYVAMGAATLVKGPIGILLLAAVIFFYLLLTKRWALLRKLNLPLGLAFFVLTAVPWSRRRPCPGI